MSIILILTIISSFGFLFVSISTIFTRTERIAIALALSSSFWITTSYVALAFSNVIPVSLIVLFWFLGSFLVFLYKHRRTILECRSFRDVKWENILSRVHIQGKYIDRPSFPTIIFLLCFIVLLFISFQPIAPLNPEFTWHDPYTSPRESG